jgi:molybdopterin-dependent oxidoreductase-like protein
VHPTQPRRRLEPRLHLSQGHTTLGELHHDPDRLRAPLIRRNGTFVEATWSEAFAECERLLHGVVERHGKEALTYYVGNPTVHNFSLLRYVAAFGALAGVERLYSAGTIDQWPKNVACALMYGGMWGIPTPDIDRTDHLVIMGANPHASQGSLMACPDFLGRLADLRARGGKAVVIDPRRTGTAQRADEWVAIRPGTDAALLMAWVHVLFEEGLVGPGRLADLTNGIDDVRALCRQMQKRADSSGGSIRRDANPGGDPCAAHAVDAPPLGVRRDLRAQRRRHPRPARARPALRHLLPQPPRRAIHRTLLAKRGLAWSEGDHQTATASSYAPAAGAAAFRGTTGHNDDHVHLAPRRPVE